MADPFLDDESSVQDSLAREIYEFTVGGIVYRMTSASHDITVDGEVYTAEAVSRSQVELVQLGGDSGGDSITISLRVDHPIVRRWLAQGVPPKVATVLVRRLQERSGLVERIWSGDIASVDAEDGSVKLTVSSLFSRAFRRRLPTLTVGRQCAHVLYGVGCNVSRTGSSPDAIPFRAVTTVQTANGRDVRLSVPTIPVAAVLRAKWLQFGELVHVASGERMTIVDQADVDPGHSDVTILTLQAHIYGMKVGDSVELYAGCDHTVTTCRDKFANQVNFGGFPSLPTRNPFFPTGLGVMEQT